ncbi:MAG: phosphotransferase [Alphaproteobacteria bacterium]
MPNIWDKTIQINEELVKKLLFNQFDICINDIELFGEGFDNSAYLINKEFVFRFPHRDFAKDCMENELLLLPYLVDKVSFQITNPIFIGNATEYYPYSFAGYKLLKGQILTNYCNPHVSDIESAITLGTWLKELHSIPISKELCGKIKGNNSWRLNKDNRIQVLLNTVTKYEHHFIKGGNDIKFLVSSIENLSNLNFNVDPAKFCCLHGDLYSKHIIVDKAGIPFGLIDWGDTHIGHPAIDLSVGFMIFDESARESFFDSYGKIDDNTLNIAIFRSFCHAIVAYAYFCEIGETNSILWTKAAIDNSIKAVTAYYNNSHF